MTGRSNAMSGEIQETVTITIEDVFSSIEVYYNGDKVATSGSFSCAKNSVVGVKYSGTKAGSLSCEGGIAFLARHNSASSGVGVYYVYDNGTFSYVYGGASKP